MKNRGLWDYIQEMDDEFDLRILSTYNIHRDEYLDPIKTALERYDLRFVELGPISVLQTNHPDFPESGLCQSYELKVKVGQMPDSGTDGLALEIAQKCGEYVKPSDQDCFRCYYVGGEPETTSVVYDENEEEPEGFGPQLGTVVGEHESDIDNTVADLAGSGRVQNFLTRAKKNRDTRESRRKEALRRVIATHDVLKDVLGESVVRGFYKVRIDEEKGEHMIDGPYDQMPEDGDGFEFVKTATRLRDRIKDIS